MRATNHRGCDRSTPRRCARKHWPAGRWLETRTGPRRRRGERLGRHASPSPTTGRAFRSADPRYGSAARHRQLPERRRRCLASRSGRRLDTRPRAPADTTMWWRIRSWSAAPASCATRVAIVQRGEVERLRRLSRRRRMKAGHMRGAVVNGASFVGRPRSSGSASCPLGHDTCVIASSPKAVPMSPKSGSEVSAPLTDRGDAKEDGLVGVLIKASASCPVG